MPACRTDPADRQLTVAASGSFFRFGMAAQATCAAIAAVWAVLCAFCSVPRLCLCFSACTVVSSFATECGECRRKVSQNIGLE